MHEIQNAITLNVQVYVYLEIPIAKLRKRLGFIRILLIHDLNQVVLEVVPHALKVSIGIFGHQNVAVCNRSIKVHTQEHAWIDWLHIDACWPIQKLIEPQKLIVSFDTPVQTHGLAALRRYRNALQMLPSSDASCFVV